MASPAALAARPPLSPVVLLVAAAIAAIQISAAGRYGIFRDEFYYLMCADHLAWGYVDHPPLAMAFLRGWVSLVGDGVLALRTPPALLNGLVALGAAVVAREMRGSASAQVLAAIAAGLAPGVLAICGFYSMNAFDVFFWITAAAVFCRLTGSTRREWWWAAGLVAGLGLLNKYSLAFLLVGLVVGLILSPARARLRSRNLLVAACIAGVMIAPHLAWEVGEGWPTLEFMRNATMDKNVGMSPATFWSEQMLMAHPLFLPLALAGALALVFSRRLRPWQPIGIGFLVVAAWLTFSRAKPYYLVPAYPMVLAAGAVILFDWIGRWRRVSHLGAVVLPALAVIGGMALAPMAIPLLDIEAYLSYERALGLRPADMETTATAELPQHFADRFGWQELTTAVTGVVDSLRTTGETNLLVVTGNYGECGALRYFGRDDALPPVVSGHNSCFDWWPPAPVPEVVIVVGGSREQLEQQFEHVRLGARTAPSLAMPYERNLPVWVCRRPRKPWPEVRQGARFAI